MLLEDHLHASWSCLSPSNLQHSLWPWESETQTRKTNLVYCWRTSITLGAGYSIALFNKLSSKECWNSMHVHVSPISGPEWGKFLLFSHSVNSYRASVCQALGVFLFFFLLLLFPVLFSWIISLSKCLWGYLKKCETIYQTCRMQGTVRAIRALPTPLRKKAWEGVKESRCKRKPVRNDISYNTHVLSHPFIYSLYVYWVHLLDSGDIVVNTQTRSLPSLSLYL